VKVRDVINLLEADGWRQGAPARQSSTFRHPIKSGSVTVAGKAGAEIPRGTLGSVRRQAGLKHKPRLPNFGPAQRHRRTEEKRERDA
jgi:predicted RNA binding protein YcfA (HicA-like mRNA interferase family)